MVQRQIKQGFRRDVFATMESAKLVNLTEGVHPFELVRVGIPRDPQQFIAAAVKLGHRLFRLARVNKESLEARNSLVGDATSLSRLRTQFLNQMLQRAKDLRPEEDVLHKSLPGHI